MTESVLPAVRRRPKGGWLPCLALFLAATAGAQEVLTIPVAADGQPDPPPGVRLDRVGVIDTFAGSGEEGDGGDGGTASQAEFRFPRSVAVDAAGNVYVADTRNHRIRKIDAEGVISTFAGTGEDGDEGDGGPASQARLCYPAGVSVDAKGNVYVADSWNHRVRRIDPDGVISTLAGTGSPGSGGDGGPASQAQVAYPAAVAVGPAGDLYVADSRNHRIRRVSPEGVISTLAGTGVPGYGGDGGTASRARLGSPGGVATDTAGNVYVADSWNHRVRRISTAGLISTLAGTGARGDAGDDGPAAEAELAYPAAVATGPVGNLYVVSYVPGSGNHRVRRINAAGVISAFAGVGEGGFGGDRGPAPGALLAYPVGVAADGAGNVYIADARNARIRVVRPGFQLGVPLGNSGDSVALVVAEGGVLTLDGDPVTDGRQVTADHGNAYALTGRPGGGVAATYMPQSQRVQLPRGSVTVTRDEDGTWRIGDDPVENGHRHLLGSMEYVLEFMDGTWGLAKYVVEAIAGKTAAVGRVPATAARFENPTDVAVDATGNMYVADVSRHRILRIDSAGVVTSFAGTGDWGDGGDGGPASQANLNNPSGVEADAAGNVYIAEEHGHRVRRVDAAGRITTFAGTGDPGYGGDGGPAFEARISYPQGVAVDSVGNVFVAEGGGRVRRVDAEGLVATFAGTRDQGYGGDGGPASDAQLMDPANVAVDAAGNVYVADRRDNRVRKIDTSGMITTVAGTGDPGNAGDGGPASQARFRRPEGVAVDSSGAVYVADRDNNRIRKIDASGTITAFAGTGDRGNDGDGGPASQAQFRSPEGVALDSLGNVYVADRDNHVVRKIDPSGVISTMAGTGEWGYYGASRLVSEAQFQFPTGAALDPSGNLLFGDSDRVWKLDPTGTITPLGEAADGLGQWFAGPGGLAVDLAGNTYVTEEWVGRVSRIDVAGAATTIAGIGERGYAGDGGPAVEAQLRRPKGIAVDTAGNVYVGDHTDHRVRRIDTTGMISTIAGTGERGYAGDGGPAVKAQLDGPSGIAVDSAGTVYVAEKYKGRVRKIDVHGLITTYATVGGRLEVLATDGSGNLYVGGGRRIRKIDSKGTISVIAGTGKDGLSGDGGPGRSARLSVYGIAVSRAGDIWFADGNGRRIRVLRFQGR